MSIINIFGKIIDPHFKAHRKAYFFQTLIGSLYIFCFFCFTQQFEQNLLIAPIAASTFITFAFPKAKATHHRFLIGSYITAGLTGCIFHYIFNVLLLSPSGWILFCCFLNFFCTMFLMAVLNFEHPPAAALSIFLLVQANPLSASVLSVSGILGLCLVKKMLDKRLVNLSGS